MNNERLVVGIDWGTTTWEVARIGKNGRPENYRNSEGKKKTDSAIWFKKDGQIVHGPKAKRMYPLEPDRVLKEFKPELDEENVDFAGNGLKEVSQPIDLTRLSFENIKENIEEELSRQVKEAVITVPAYFHQIGIERIKKGAEKAGLKVKEILKEPAAAAIYYAIDREVTVSEKIMVYDAGGGTLDVSILEVNKDNDKPDLKIMKNAGDTNLGGRDFDQLILEEIFAKKFEKKYGFDPTEDPEVKARWLVEAETVKKELSSYEEDATTLQAKGESMQVEVTRKEFNSLIKPLVEKTIGIIENDLLAELSLAKDEIDHLMFVGDATRTPAVRNCVSEFVGLEPVVGNNPGLAVSKGAAVMSGALANQVIRDKDGTRINLIKSSVNEAVSHSLGVEAIDPKTGDSYNEVLIEADQPLEARGSKLFRPSKDDANEVEITILEGEKADLSECRVLQEGYKLSINKPRAAERIDIEITLVVNKDGLIEVIAETDAGDKLREEFSHPSIAGNNN